MKRNGNYSVKLKTIVETHDLHPLHLSKDYDSALLTTADINRPAMQLTGFYNYFDPKRLQIVGRVDDEYSHGLADEIVKKGDGRYLIDGSLSIDDLEDLLGFLPEEASECETAAGILLAAFDRIPEEGDTVSFTGRDAKATFTVADMDRHRVDKILVRVEQIPREDAEE